MQVSPAVIVIGAGVVGCTVAHQLARSGAKVQVLETRQPGQGATRASAGILAPYIEGHESGALRSLGRRSLDLFDPFIAQLRADSGHDLIYRRTGTFELALEETDVDRLRRLSSALSASGVESRWVLPADFAKYEPLASPAALGALLIPTHGFVGVMAVTLAAAAAAQKCGAHFRTELGAIRVFASPMGRVGVEAGGTSWQADHVVLAAGSWSSQLRVEGADVVPVKPIRGQLIQLQAEPGAMQRVIWGSAGYLVPWPDGAVLVGSTVEDVGFDESHTEEAVRGLQAAAVALVPSLATAAVTSVRTGLRPRGPDDLPILGRSAVVPGLIYATAHYRNGVLLTPLTVRLVDDLVFDKGGDPALRDLDPARHGRL